MPAAFQIDERETVEFIRSIGAGHLVTTLDGQIESTFVPFSLDRRGESWVIRAHVSRANPHGRSLDGAPALLIVGGADAYVSPTNYPSKADDGKVVPTWNYLIAHVRGTVTAFDDRAALRHLVSALTDLHEADQAHPWSVDDAPDDYFDAMLKGIVGIEMQVDSIEGKAKLSQNRPQTDRVAVREAFLRGTDRQRRVGELMQD